MHSVNLKITGRWKQGLASLALCVLLLTGTLAIGGESEDGGGVLRSRVYPFKHISSDQARDLFLRLNIGKSYNTLTPDVLIVTSNIGSDLIKATEIANMLDRTPPVQIRTLMVASESEPLPPLDEFFATLGSISVGTMTEAPPKGAERQAIIDVLDDELIAIATEDIQVEIQAAIIDWNKKHSTSTSESQEVLVSASEEVSEKPLEESSTQVEPKIVEKPEEIAEPNVPRIPPEPKDLADAVLEMPGPVKQAVAEESGIAPISSELQLSVETALEEVALQVFEAQSMTDSNDPSAKTATEYTEVPAEPNAPADAQLQDEVEEDFLNEGLLEVLAEAEQEAVPAEDVVTAEPAPEEKDDRMKIIQALLAQAKAEEEQALGAQKEAELPLEQEAAIVVETIQTAEPVEETATLQAELALLRQRLAELEARSVIEKEPASEAPAEESTIPADAAQSKIQKAQSVQTKPQFDSQLSEKELDTVIDLPQEVELESLVDLVGKQFGLNYYYDPAILKGQKVKLSIHGGKIKVRETYELLESVLRQKGFVMTRRGQLVTIIKTADANQAEKLGDIEIREPGDPIPPGTLIVSTKFKLDHISTASAKNMLTQLQLGMANGLQEMSGTNTLIVTDYTYRMDQIQKVLDMIDVAGEEKEYEFRTLKYMKPSEMVPKLQELAKQLEGVSLQISTPAVVSPRTRAVTTRDPKTGRTTTKQVPVATTTPAAAKTPQADSVFIDTDDRTNRILMAGKADQIVMINELIDALDVPQYDLKIVREYIIQNVEAGDVIDVLNELALASVTVSTPKTGSATAARTPAAASRTPARTPARTPTPAQSAAGGDQPYISIRPATNSLLVNATAEQHKAIELVIAHVDVVQKDQRTIRQYEIQYVDTQEIMDTLTDLEIIAPETGSRGTSSRNTNSRSSRQTTSRSPQQPQAGANAEGAAQLSLPTADGSSGKDITAERPQISVLETTNSLLVYATPRQHDAIALVIAHADRTPDTISTPYVVYALENQDPLELAEVLTKLIQETIEEVQKASTPESKIQRGGETTTAAKLPTLEEQNIRVIPDEPSYSLIVYANKRNQQWISELIKELDEYRPQVLLDCTLVEISQDESFKYEMDIIGKTYGGSTLQDGTSVTTINGSDFSDSRLADASSLAGSFTGFFNSEMVQALLETVQTNGYGRIMARPKILVNDNQEGEITTTNTTAIAQVSSQTQVPDQGTPITTQDVTFTDYEEGVTLNIKPHISQGEMLRLEILLNRTDFDLQPDVEISGPDGTATFPSPPDRLSTDVVTVATVPDGTTIILGGLESIDQQKYNSKVPILGDLPIIGGLFRGIDNTGDQGRLYVFVKANIIRPGDQVEGLQDIKRVSAKNRNEFEKMEDRFQSMQDWPGIDPEPMDPIKVLEDDDFQIEDKLEGDFVVQDKWPVG